MTFKPNRVSPRETPNVPVRKLDDGVDLVPGYFSLIFDLTINHHANIYIVNNVARSLVDRLTINFAREIVQDTNGYDFNKPHEDLFLTENDRARVFTEGIKSVNLFKIRCNAVDKKKSELTKRISSMIFYESKYMIPLDHKILKDHGVFFPRPLSDELVFKLSLAPASNVVIGSDKARLAYEFRNIQLEYEVIHSQEPANKA